LRDHIPRARRSQIGDAGRASEKRLGKSLGARLRPASGAMASAKGDMTVGKDWLVESKATEANSMKLEYSWLGKISQEALMEGRTPALTVSFVDKQGRAVNFGDWVLVPRTAWDELRGETGGVLDCEKGS
jgi:hypothetical protein